MSPAAGVALVLVLLGGLMLAVRAAQKRNAIGAELARKLVHMGMGTTCLAFPWIFSSPRPVWVLGILAAGTLLAIRGVPLLQTHLGQVLGGVERASLGDVCFPLAVALVFTLAEGNIAAFCAPVAILTFADTAGALVGQRWGRTRYRAVESMKSLEGSAAVFGITCISVMLIIGIFGSSAWPELVFTGLIMGAFAALVEAVSWRGLDNLLVPLVASAQMRIYPQLAWSDLALRAVVMGTLVAVMLNWRGRLLHFSAQLGAALTMYLFWSLGGWPWLLAPAVLLASYSWLTPADPGGVARYHLAAVLCIGSAGVLWAGLNAWQPAPLWLWLFTVGFATQQAIIAAVRFSQARPQWPPWRWWLVAWAQAVTLQVLVYVGANGATAIALREYGSGLLGMAVALAGFMSWDRELALPEDLNARWWRQGVTAVLASVTGFALLQL